jgi:hypothetical protein
MKDLTYLILVAAIIFLFALRECDHRKNAGQYPQTDTIVQVDTIPGDSIPYRVEIKIKEPVPVYRDTGSIRWREMDIDTLAILNAYFTTNYYHDTLMNDTSAFISLKSIVWQNLLFYDELYFQNRRPTQIITTLTPPTLLRNRYYFGLGTTILGDHRSFTTNLMLVNRSGMAFSAGYDFINENIALSGYYQFRYKK